MTSDVKHVDVDHSVDVQHVQQSDKTKMKAERSRDGHVIFHLDLYSKTELKELKERFISDLEKVRKLMQSVESRESGNSVKKDCVRGKRKGTMQVSEDRKIKRKRGEEKDQVVNSMEIRKVEAAMMRKCGVILEKLMKHKHGWVFNKPVDVVSLRLDDYYQVVKHPMDLGTVKLNLGKRVYGTPMHFAKDVRLTFDNAMLYNRKGEDVYTMATVLLNLFDKLFDRAYEKYEVERQRVIVEQKKFGEPLAEFTQSQVVASQRDTKKPLQMHPQAPLPKKICKGGGKKSVSKQKITVPEAKENPQSGKEMSLCERNKLGFVLQDLAGECLNEILEIVGKRNSKMTTPGEDGEIVLDVHDLDSETMWDLHRFARLRLKADQNRTKKQEITSQSTLTLENNKSPVAITNETAKPATPKEEEDIDIGDEMPGNDYPPVVIEREDTLSSSSGTDSSSDSDSSSGSDSEINDVV